MKFGQQLEANIFPQWAQYYVRYRQIKNHIEVLFPTPSERHREALADRDRATKSLLGITDPEQAKIRAEKRDNILARQQTVDSSSAKSSRLPSALSPSPSPSPSAKSNDSDEHEGTSLLHTDPLPDGLVSSSIASSAATAASPAEQRRTEKLAFNIGAKSYGGLDHDDVSSGDEHDEEQTPSHSPATGQGSSGNSSTAATGSRTRFSSASQQRLHVQLEGIEIIGASASSSQLQQRSDGTSVAAITPTDSPALSRADSPVLGLPPLPPSAASVAAAASSAAPSASVVAPSSTSSSSSQRPQFGRHVSAVAADGSLVVSHRRFHVLAPQTHLQKLDQVCVKLMSELQKIDEFHRLMEAKVAAAFEGLKAQVFAARDGDPADTGSIHRKLKEMKAMKQALWHNRRASGGHGGTLTASRSATSLAEGEDKELGLGGGSGSTLHSGRESPSGEDNSAREPMLPHGNHSRSNSQSQTQAHGVGHVRYHATQVTPSSNGHRSHTYHHALRKERERERQRERSDSTGSDRHGGLDSIPLRAAFSQLLRRATMLIHFVDINFVAFAKLLKCLEKRAMQALKSSSEGRNIALVVHSQRVHKQLLSTLQNRRFYTSRKVDEYIVPELYRMYADLYENGNTDRAKLVLLANLTEQQYSSRDSFWLGVKLGCIFMLLGLLCVIMVRPEANVQLVQEMQFFAPVYRCVGLLIVLLWLWSFLVQLWDNFSVPYVLMFQLNPRTRLTHFQLQVEAANLTIVYLFNSLLFLTHSGQWISERFSLAIYPSALFLFLLVKLFAPWRRISHWGTRLSLLSTLAQVALAPFGKTRFLDSFVGDFLTSMVKIIVDVETATCLLATYFFLRPERVLWDCGAVAKIVVPILCALPLWWRFQQCLRRYWDTGSRKPHVYNALKYLISHSVVIMAAYHPVVNDHHATSWQTYRIVWVACCVVSTLYSTWWDLVMDWGFLSRDSLWPGLRRELLYGEHNAHWYYAAMLSNCLLRWVWVLTIVPFSFEENDGDPESPTNILTALVSWDKVLIPVLALLELLRRFQWAIFRVEYEQIVQGTKLRVDPHLPIFIQQLAKSSAEKSAEKAARDMDFSVLSEVIGMALCLIVIALIAALS